MQQSSATQSLHLSFWGLRKIVACSHSSSQYLLVSTVFGTYILLHFYTCIHCLQEDEDDSFLCSNLKDILRASFKVQ